MLPKRLKSIFEYIRLVGGGGGGDEGVPPDVTYTVCFTRHFCDFGSPDLEPKIPD